MQLHVKNRVLSCILLFSFVIVLSSCEGVIPVGDLTDETPPVVLSVSPANGSVDQPINGDVLVTLDDTINPLTVTTNNIYLLEMPSSAYVQTEALYGEYGKVIGLRPKANLKTNTSYELHVGTGIQNVASLSLGSEFVSTFTTGTNLAKSSATVITFVSPTNGQHLRGSVAVSGTSVNGVTNMEVSFLYVDSLYGTPIQLNDPANWSHTWDTDPLTEGVHTLYVTTRDAAGGFSTNQISVTVDRTAPSHTIATPTEGEVVSGTNYLISGTASDLYGLSRVEVKIGTNDWALAQGTTGWTFTYDTFGKPDGDYVISVRTTDLAGNTNIISRNVTFDNWSVYNSFNSQPVTGYDVYFVAQSDSVGGIIYGTGSKHEPMNNGSILDSTDHSGLYTRVAASASAFHYLHWGWDYGDTVVTDLVYRKSTGGSYVIADFDVNGNWAEYYSINLSLNPDGNPHIVWAEAPVSGNPSSSTWKLNYSVWNGSGFTKYNSAANFNETATDSYGTACDVGISSSYETYLAYVNKTKGKLRFRKLVFSPSLTLIRSTDIDDATPGAVSIAVENGAPNTIHVAYVSGSALKYACSTDDGATFTVSTIDTGAGGFADIAFKDGVLAIAVIRNGALTVYKKSTTSGWQTMTAAWDHAGIPSISISDNYIWVAYKGQDTYPHVIKTAK